MTGPWHFLNALMTSGHKHFLHYFARGIRWGPVDSSYKGPVVQSMGITLLLFGRSANKLFNKYSWCRWYDTLWRCCDRYIHKLRMIRWRELEMGHRIYTTKLFDWMENRPISSNRNGWSFGRRVATFKLPTILKPLMCWDRDISV